MQWTACGWIDSDVSAPPGLPLPKAGLAELQTTRSSNLPLINGEGRQSRSEQL